MEEYKSRNPFQGNTEDLAAFDIESRHIHLDTTRNEVSEGIAENMTDVHEFSDHLHTNTVRKEVSEGIAENLANINEESVDHINANTANNDLASGIPEKLTKVVEGSEDTDAHHAVNNDDGVTEIHGTDSSRKTISCDRKTENSNGETISSGTESSSTGKTPRFYVGQRFAELEDFLHFKKTFEDSNFCQLYNKDVRYLEAAEKRVPKRVPLAKTSLKYYSLLLYVSRRPLENTE